MDYFLLGNQIPENRQLGITDGNQILEKKPKNLFISDPPNPNEDSTTGSHLKFLLQLVSCPQPASVRRKAHMATYATHCRVSACVSQGWWASSVTAVPLDSGSPTAQVII